MLMDEGDKVLIRTLKKDWHMLLKCGRDKADLMDAMERVLRFYMAAHEFNKWLDERHR